MIVQSGKNRPIWSHWSVLSSSGNIFQKSYNLCLPICHSETEQSKVTCYQCDQIGRFLEPLDNKFSNKNSPNVWRLLGQFWNTYFLSQAAVATFWEIWATFYSKIWTHCILQLFIKEAHFFVLSYNNNDNNGGPTPQKHLPPTLSLRNILKTWIPHFHLIYVTLLHHGIKAINGSNGSGF